MLIKKEEDQGNYLRGNCTYFCILHPKENISVHELELIVHHYIPSIAMDWPFPLTMIQKRYIVCKKENSPF